MDQITIQEVVVNRGNCSVSAYGTPFSPRTLVYGKSYKYNGSNFNSILEVTVRTDKGEYKFKK